MYSPKHAANHSTNEKKTVIKKQNKKFLQFSKLLSIKDKTVEKYCKILINIL